MCDIQIEEVCTKTSEDDTEQCELATDIVTIIENALAEKEGFYNLQEK